MTLPEFSGTAATEGKLAGGKGVVTIEGGASIKCESITGKFTFESGSRRSGPVTLDINECTEGGEQCRSLGDVLGVTLITGTWHLVLMTRASVDGHYVLVSLNELHIECPGGAIKLILVTGSILGSTAAEAGSETEFGLTVKDNRKAQEFTEYENDAGTAVKASLAASQEGGKSKAAFEESEDNLLTFNGSTKIDG
jgi:hypothetical protein